MINKIKNNIEKELPVFLAGLDKKYLLRQASPVLFKCVSDFVLRKGKRARPILFIIGYRGFSGRNPRGLYTSALSLEMLHDFMLVHDDIIDKSLLRRGKPSMHKMLNDYLGKYQNAKFNGQDLAIVSGDIMYAMGLEAFLSVEEDLRRKENALKKLIDAAVYTGCGEFIELLYGIKDVSRITKEDIYKIYDFKTAIYTFAAPLSMGAALAGAQETQADILFKYGIYLGRAFQIKDDVLGMFGNEKGIGKSILTDLQEAKKTVLIWYAFNHSGRNARSEIKKILSKEKISRVDLVAIRKIITASGALDFAKKEISGLISQAQALIKTSKMRTLYKEFLYSYARQILSL
ncbi:MAG: polyprenyl synthetase family protein [Candidatus Omnitrophica bacterium]|nr:polyprenyl synthetase family protein [Candidatus Omnitrophota bacterium]